MLGAAGRMGGEVCRAVEGADDLDLVARLDEGDALSGLAEAGAQVVVDFTHPGAVLDNIRFVVDAGIEPLVDSVLPLADARDGFARMAEGAVTGKVVFSVGAGDPA